MVENQVLNAQYISNHASNRWIKLTLKLKKDSKKQVSENSLRDDLQKGQFENLIF